MYSAMVNTNGTTPFLFTDNMRFLTQLTTSSYNGIVQQGDNGIIYGNSQNKTALSIGPFNSGPSTGIRIDASGIVNITTQTDSTSVTTGALVVSGGVGIGSNTNIGGNLQVSGNLVTLNGVTLPDSANFSTPSSGQLGYTTTVAQASGLNTQCTSNGLYNIYTISLSPGVWMMTAYASIICTTAGTLYCMYSGISSVSATLIGRYFSVQTFNNSVVVNSLHGVPHVRVITVTATTNYYLVIQPSFSSGAFQLSPNYSNLTATRIA